MSERMEEEAFAGDFSPLYHASQNRHTFARMVQYPSKWKNTNSAFIFVPALIVKNSDLGRQPGRTRSESHPGVAAKHRCMECWCERIRCSGSKSVRHRLKGTQTHRCTVPAIRDPLSIPCFFQAVAPMVRFTERTYCREKICCTRGYDVEFRREPKDKI